MGTSDKGKSADKGTASAKGQQHEGTMTRINPETGVSETQTVTNERWRTEGKQLRAEGWTRPDDEEDSTDSGGTTDPAAGSGSGSQG